MLPIGIIHRSGGRGRLLYAPSEVGGRRPHNVLRYPQFAELDGSIVVIDKLISGFQRSRVVEDVAAVSKLLALQRLS